MFTRRYLSTGCLRTWNTVNIRSTHYPQRYNLFNHNYQRIIARPSTTKHISKMNVQLYVYDLSQVSKYTISEI